MKNKHISEIELQQYVLCKDDCDMDIIEHINQCEKCKVEVEIYHLLFYEIKKQPETIFDFDLANLVMQHLPEKQNVSELKMNYPAGIYLLKTDDGLVQKVSIK